MEQAAQQYVQITVSFNTPEDTTEIQLPSWRPGRYELGDFAKNVKSFKVFDDQNKLRPAFKITKDRWQMDTSNTATVKVTYSYYANELNAGSTYLCDNQLYVNPVNCCVYKEGSFNEEIEVELAIPDNWEIATSLKKKGKKLFAENYEELFDSPFIASGRLQHRTYDVNGTTFYIWFNGEVKPQWEKVIGDFKAFTEVQVKKYTEFPVKEYHFLNQIVPYKAYHGVEHLRSTVVLLGPSYDIFSEQYKELLGVSSHELYHAWNVKTIRPIEMYPYDYTTQNYSRLGYLCEGVTTYMGDLCLYKGGVFNESQYFVEFNRQLQKHFDNPGRFNYSVAESSFDTWLDGYQAGTPGRKVSIYTEGCLLSFVLDVKIRRATNNKYGIDEVMKRLYFNYALNNKGVSESDYKQVAEEVAGINFDGFFEDYIYGSKPFESILTKNLDYLGLELNHEPSKSYAEGRLGFKSSKNGKNFVIKGMYPGGPAETAGLMLEDEIIAINSMSCEGELDKWFNYFDDDHKILTFLRAGELKQVTMPEVNRFFYLTYSVKKVENPNSFQEKAYEAWKK